MYIPKQPFLFFIIGNFSFFLLQVDLALDVEKALPLSVRQKLLKIEETIQPNKDKAWSFWSFWRLKSSPLTAIGSLSQLVRTFIKVFLRLSNIPVLKCPRRSSKEDVS